MKIFYKKDYGGHRIIYLFGIKILSFKRKAYLLENIYLRVCFFEGYLKLKQEFNIELPAEACGSGTNFEIVRCKLKDLRCRINGKLVKINDTMKYKYLETKDKDLYIKTHVQLDCYSNNTLMRSVEKYQDLIKSIDENGYDPSKSVICIRDEDNLILSGLHRSTYLYYKYGPDYEIVAVKISK